MCSLQVSTKVAPLISNTVALGFQSLWDYEAVLLKGIDFNFEGTPEVASGIAHYFKYVQAQVYRCIYSVE
jgi:hypothetical protein